ncbi:MAG: ABC transporter ATP-binding protein [Erysipelotrichaceae bacterium]|nr:ABC transporter ATP-binding protein [Erysipelotrichaceae bacterium]
MYIEIQNIYKSYNHAQVLNDVSLSLDKGEICCIIGPSGSGKSTLLNMIGALDEVDSGSIMISNLDITKLKSKELLKYRKRELGFIFQMYNLIGNLTVKENIEVCQYLSDNPLPINDLLETLGLQEHQYKFPHQLSGGQQQRTAIARAIIKNPQLLLCDEPTGALDSQNAKDILMLLETINQKYHTTIIMVTHNNEITKMADCIINIKDGQIVSNLQQSKISAKDIEL